MSRLKPSPDCRRCERLVAHRQSVAPRKGLRAADYWNRPVFGFGDPEARICIVGLAPGAHGANRTGRPFTGDGAGDFMYPLLYQVGLSNQPEALHQDDGLQLQDLFITNAVKCLPPDNKPNAAEFAACRSLLAEDMESLVKLQVILTLGAGAHTSVLHLLKERGMIRRLSECRFGHAVRYQLPDGRWLLGSYHTSRYNVQTRRITSAMFIEVLDQAKQLAGLV